MVIKCVINDEPVSQCSELPWQGGAASQQSVTQNVMNLGRLGASLWENSLKYVHNKCVLVRINISFIYILQVASFAFAVRVHEINL